MSKLPLLELAHITEENINSQTHFRKWLITLNLAGRYYCHTGKISL
jgi:hypothetical protein